MEDTPTPTPTARPQAKLSRAGRPSNARVQKVPTREELNAAQEQDRAETQRLFRTHRRVVDGLQIDRALIPPGFDYEWKRETCFGEHDIDHMTNLQENHWKPVPASRHPNMMPADKRGGAIHRKGLILMERPSYLTKEAREEDLMLARQQVQVKEDQLGKTPAGTRTPNRIAHDIHAQILVAKD